MSAANAETAILPIVREVDELLETLQGELDSARSPHRMALRSLGLERDGWTPRAYSEEAFRIWEEHLRRLPDDLETLHHLAIMHHARAIDLETGPKPRESDHDWKKALHYWTRLLGEDRFWEGLAAVACKGTRPDAVHALREALPRRLLRIHFDIAFDEVTRREHPHRSSYHMELAGALQTPPEHLHQVREQVYAERSALVPDAAWRSNELDPKVLAEGSRVILDFLDLVPDCLTALQDAVRLQVRTLNAWYTDFQAAGEDNEQERRRLLAEFKTAGTRWRAHFDLLAQRAEEADESARHGLCHWYRIMAEIHRALDASTEAESLYEAGIRAGEPGDDEHTRCIRGLGDTRALAAREKASQGARDARAACELARGTPGLSRYAQWMLANAYLLIDDYDRAETIRAKAATRPVEEADLDDYDSYQHVQGQLEELREIIVHHRRESEIAPILEEAQQHMQAQRFVDALKVLAKALDLDPESANARFLRCQCYLAENLPADARRDLEAFRRVVEARHNSEGIAAAKQLEREHLHPMEQLAAKFGQEGFRKRAAAIAHANNDDLATAIRLLREALATAPLTGQAQLKQELATLEQRQRQAAEYQQFQQEMGSERAMELRQQSITAWNADRLDHALELMRSAYAESKRARGREAAPKLKKEFAEMLTGIAIRRVNALQENTRRNRPGLMNEVQVLTQAKGLLEEATGLDPSNTNASHALNALQMMLDPSSFNSRRY